MNKVAKPVNMKLVGAGLKFQKTRHKFIYQILAACQDLPIQYMLNHILIPATHDVQNQKQTLISSSDFSNEYQCLLSTGRKNVILVMLHCRVNNNL